VCCHYEGSKQINNPPLSKLTKGDHNQCFKEKLAIISRLFHIEPTSSYSDYWEVAIELLRWSIVCQLQQAAGVKQLEPNMATSEPNTTSSYKPYLVAAIELLTWPIISWVQQDADIAPPALEPDMNRIILIYRNVLKKKGLTLESLPRCILFCSV
jgi:hypothetical protein